MRYKRVELHNHSIESDGSLTIEELMDYGKRNKFEVIAITDHNTCAGHRKAEAWIKKNGKEVDFLRGVEVTTFFGHILALGLDHMIDIKSLDPDKPEWFLQTLKNHGATVGIAHPFCIGKPIMAGCRFSMNITDWSCLDYIEVFNTSSQDEFCGNEKAVELWENKVLEGVPLAAVTGKDLHRKPQNNWDFITYVLLNNKGADSEDGVLEAIQNQNTVVTKGPIVIGTWEGKNEIKIELNHTSPYFGWNERVEDSELLFEVKTDQKERVTGKVMGNDPIIIPLKEEASSIVIKLYDKVVDFHHLLAIAPPLFLKREELK